MSDILKNKFAATLERELYEKMARPMTGTVADPAPADKTLTVEKLLKSWNDALKDLPAPDPLDTVDQIWCSARMKPQGRRVCDALNASRRQPLSRQVLLVVKEHMPDGFILGMRPGEFFRETAFMIGPKTDLDMSK